MPKDFLDDVDIWGSSETDKVDSLPSFFDKNKSERKCREQLEEICFKIRHGRDGNHGHHGRDGKDGKDGKRGPKGCDGRDGKDGKDGERGSRGERGRDGKDGTCGRDGDCGKDGKDRANNITFSGCAIFVIEGHKLLKVDAVTSKSETFLELDRDFTYEGISSVNGNLAIVAIRDCKLYLIKVNVVKRRLEDPVRIGDRR